MLHRLSHPTPDVPRLRCGLVVAGTLVLLVHLCAASGRAQQSRPDPNPGACRVESVTREALRTPQGDELYVEASSLTPSGGDLLLAGTPNYIMRPAPAGGEPARSVGAYEVFGAIVRRDGSVALVPAPMPAWRISGVRAAARRGGGWHVVFAEGEKLGEGGIADPAVRLWYGVLRDTSWGPLEALPLPAGDEVSTLTISSLVQRADSLALAAIVERREAGRGIAVFDRRGTGWEGTVIRGLYPAYVEPVWLPSGPLQLAVVRGDDTFREDTNSLLLYALRPEVGRVRRIASGQVAAAHAPLFSPAQGGYLVGLLRPAGVLGGIGRATLWPLDETRSAVELDTLALQASPVSVPGGAMVVVDQMAGEYESRDVALYRAGSERAHRIGSFPHPFDGFFAAALLSPTELVLAGPVRVPVAGGEFVESQLLRATLRCDAG